MTNNQTGTPLKFLSMNRDFPLKVFETPYSTGSIGTSSAFKIVILLCGLVCEMLYNGKNGTFGVTCGLNEDPF